MLTSEIFITEMGTSRMIGTKFIIKMETSCIGMKLIQF